MSNPFITTNSGSSYYPLFYSPPQISASALTPSTMFPIISIPSAPTFSSFPVVSGFPTIPVMPTLMPSVVTYPDINSDKNLRHEIINYFYDKVVNNWLKYHYLDIYQFFVVTGGKVSLVKDLKQIETNTKNDPSEAALKHKYIVENYLTEEDVFHLLNKFRKRNNLNLWDLKKYSDEVRNYISHKVKKYLKNQILKNK